LPTATLILASASATRLGLLHAAGLPVAAHPVRLDEPAIRAALAAEGATPRDMADALAELKAQRAADRHPGAVVIGCDQVLDADGVALGKPDTPQQALAQLVALRGGTHRLHSAVVLWHEGQPVWRHLATARMTMRDVSDGFLQDYLARNWDRARHSAGCYLVESEGIRLFAAIEGDHFGILGLPLLPLLGYLGQRGFIAT
jgi:septum formation protein